MPGRKRGTSFFTVLLAVGGEGKLHLHALPSIDRTHNMATHDTKFMQLATFSQYVLSLPGEKSDPLDIF